MARARPCGASRLAPASQQGIRPCPVLPQRGARAFPPILRVPRRVGVPARSARNGLRHACAECRSRCVDPRRAAGGIVSTADAKRTRSPRESHRTSCRTRSRTNPSAGETERTQAGRKLPKPGRPRLRTNPSRSNIVQTRTLWNPNEPTRTRIRDEPGCVGTRTNPTDRKSPKRGRSGSPGTGELAQAPDPGPPAPHRAPFGAPSSRSQGSYP